MGLILSLVLYFLAAICTNMPPEKMLPFAAQVVSKLFVLCQSENKVVNDLLCADNCRQLLAVEPWAPGLVSHTAPILDWHPFYTKLSESVTAATSFLRQMRKT